MNLTRIKTFALCLGVALLLLAGSALAGTTSATVVNYAREVGKVNQVYTLPTNTPKRDLLVVRGSSQPYFVDVTLSGGAVWTNTLAATDLTVTGTTTTATGNYTITFLSGSGTATARWLVASSVNETVLTTVTFTATGKTVKDVANVLGGGGTIQVTMATMDSATNTPFDAGSDTKDWLVGKFAVTNGTLTATKATVDVGSGRLNLAATGGDTATFDKGATMNLNNNAASNVPGTGTTLQTNGSSYTLLSTDKVNLVFAGDLSGITTIAWGHVNGTGGIVYAVTTTDRTAGSATLTVAGNSSLLSNGPNSTAIHEFEIRVDGTTVLNTRTLTVQVNLVIGTDGTSGFTANNRTVLSASTLTVWSLNGTVLVANWVNGNNTSLNSRIYLWNPSATGGSVIADVYTLAVGINNATTKLGTVNLGTLGGQSSVNIRLAEDILTPLAVTLPYTSNGGNLVVVLTIQASQVSGFSQVFSSSLVYGTVNLSVVQ